jgi:hypothetical protein
VIHKTYRNIFLKLKSIEMKTIKMFLLAVIIFSGIILTDVNAKTSDSENLHPRRHRHRVVVVHRRYYPRPVIYVAPRHHRYHHRRIVFIH